MRVVIYSRVSTDRQVHDSQLQEVRAYCDRRGWKDAVEFSDTASGATSKRTGLDALMALVRRGRVDAVVCFKLDRLGRSLAHVAQVIGEFQTHRVALICTSQGIDTSTSNPAAQLQLNILCAVAEFEREIIRERINAGLKAARARGVSFGRPSTLMKYLPHVRALREAGKNVSQIARELDLAYSSAHKLCSAAAERMM
jgi:putative DNA-invertase from lambdoid prophage Rac